MVHGAVDPHWRFRAVQGRVRRKEDRVVNLSIIRCNIHRGNSEDKNEIWGYIIKNRTTRPDDWRVANKTLELFVFLLAI